MPLPAASLQDAQELGPDALHVLLEGPEVTVLKGSHQGDCSYAFPSNLGTPGPCRLLVSVVRTQWRAIDKNIAGFPPLTLDDLTATNSCKPLAPETGCHLHRSCTLLLAPHWLLQAWM